MNKVFIFTLGTLTGAAAGSLITWKVIKDKYKKIADEEIDSVIEHFNNKINNMINDNLEVKTEPTTEAVENESLIEPETTEVYQELVEDLEYGNTTRDYIKPYVISPEEFGEFGNQTKSLTYYADGVLADEDDDILSDIEAIIGDALEHFGEYEDDCVHVRDENIECDYEVLKSEKTFSEAYNEGVK